VIFRQGLWAFARHAENEGVRILTTVAALLGTLLGLAGPARADQLITETFTGSSVTDPNFTVGGTSWTPCLTASQTTTQTPVPGCASTPTLPPGGDAPGNGALRLTPNTNTRAGFVLYNKALPLTAGVQVDFDFFAYRGSSGTGADGMAFFLADGTVNLTQPGALGGALGYGPTPGSNRPGLAGGYIGLGLDEYGNYSNAQVQGTGCPANPAVGFRPQSVALRGPGSGLAGYCLLGTTPVGPLGGISVPGATTRTPAIRSARLVVDPLGQPGAQVTAYIDFHDGVGLQQVFQAPLPANPPSTFKFGFAAATGGVNAVHEIRFLQVSSILELPRLTLTKSHTGNVVAGTIHDFQMHATVSGAAGDGPAQSPVTITDTLPAGDTVAATPSGAGWDCSATVVGSSTASCTHQASVSAPLAPGAVLPPITVPVRIPPDHVGTYVNTATASSSDNANTPEQSSASDSYTVSQRADLSLSKSASPSPVVPGTNETFELVVRNDGPSTATNVVVSDALPAALSFMSASAGCGEAAGTVTCTVGSLGPGESRTFEVTGRVASSLDQCLSNTATVTSDAADPDGNNNESTICVPIMRRADLSITKSASQTELPTGGGQVMYTLVVRNDGPSDATGVRVSDPMAPGLTLVAAEASQGSCSTAGGRVSCDLGGLVEGGSAQVLVTASAAPGSITNTATVTGDQEDTDPDDNTDSATVSAPPGPPPPPTPEPPPPGPQPPGPQPPVPTPTPFDLAITKKANVTTASVGQPVRYTITVANPGAAEAPGVKLTDTLNAPVKLVSVKTTAGSCTKRIPLRCSLGGIPAGGKVTITIVAQPKHARCRQRNAASATGAGTDANQANNLDTVDVCVRKVGLRLSKVADHSAVTAGGLIAYTIRVTNPTKGTARNVRTCDRLPAGLVYVSSKAKAKLRGGRWCWRAKTLGPGKAERYRITVRALRGTSGKKVNRATIAGSPQAKAARAKRPVRVLPAAGRGGGVTG
jgi:uncharacterized repeat protein (TIGR01451 family)